VKLLRGIISRDAYPFDFGGAFDDVGVVHQPNGRQRPSLL
jgi:hypothetical protein